MFKFICKRIYIYIYIRIYCILVNRDLKTRLEHAYFAQKYQTVLQSDP